MSAQKQVSFLNLVNEIFSSKNFVKIDEAEVGQKEKIVGQANDYEKAIYSARENLITEIRKKGEELKELKTRPDLSEIEKKSEQDLIEIEVNRLDSNIKTLGKMFYGAINDRLVEERTAWDTLEIRNDWNIVGFDLSSEEDLESAASPVEKCFLDQKKVVVTRLINEFYFNNQLLIEPDEDLNENDLVLGEANSYEKCIYNLSKLHQGKINHIAEKMKNGESINIKETEICNRLYEVYDKMFWVSVMERHLDNLSRFNNTLAIKKNWKIVATHREMNND